jgi:hypothetical protein
MRVTTPAAVKSLSYSLPHAVRGNVFDVLLERTL